MQKALCFFFPLGVLFTVLQCTGPFIETFDEPQKLVTFKNDSKDSITVQLSNSYPDTICPPFSNVLGGCLCPPLQQEDVLVYEDPNELLNKYPVIQVFVFKSSTVKEFFDTHRIFDPIGKYHLELKRYELTREWLEAHDWTVTYP